MTKVGVIPRGRRAWTHLGTPGFGAQGTAGRLARHHKSRDREPVHRDAIDPKRKSLFFRVGLLLVATVSELGG
jgi:hypothetical protein